MRHTFFGAWIPVPENVWSELLTQFWRKTVPGCVINPTYLEPHAPLEAHWFRPTENAEARRGIIGVMTDVTQILSQIESGDPSAAEQLLPLVYEELRKLAAARLAQEKPGQTLQATGLVHEAYLRLVDVEKTPHWSGRGHFFGAAAEAMRRILVDQARRKQSYKRGGRGRRVTLDAVDVGLNSPSDELLDIDEALTRLTAEDPAAAHLIQLRYFAGLSIEDAAELVGISRSTAYEHWSYARVRLKTLLDAE